MSGLARLHVVSFNPASIVYDSETEGHSFCRKCLRDSLSYSSRCPKCRESLAPGFSPNVNTVLWNTIQMLFPHTKEAPASPTPPMRRSGDIERREQMRESRTTNVTRDSRRRAELMRRHHEHSFDEQEERHSTLRSTNRRLRMQSSARVMSSSPTRVNLRGRTPSSTRTPAFNTSERSISQVTLIPGHLGLITCCMSRGRDSF